jgi:hypothetical protein
MTASVPTNGQYHQTSQALVAGNITVPAGGFRSLHLQLYEQGMPEPRFRMELNPDMRDVVSWSITRLNKDDHYELVANFQNFGDVAVGVRVLEV